METMPTTRAYVLIEADARQCLQIVASLRDMAHVVQSHTVTGPFDIVVVLETPDHHTLGMLITDQIQKLEGVKRTITSIAME